MFFNDIIDRRLAFDGVAEHYHCGRPGYPQRFFDDLAQHAWAAPSFSQVRLARVVEIGSGSGQATGQLLSGIAGQLDCVEPGAAFCRQLTQRFEAVDTVHVHCMDLEAFGGHGYDLMFSASALHWIPRETAYASAAGLLTAGGWLAAIWTLPTLSAAACELARRHAAPLDDGFDIPQRTPAVEASFNAGLDDLSSRDAFANVRSFRDQAVRSPEPQQLGDLIWSYADLSAVSAEIRRHAAAALQRDLQSLPADQRQVRDHYLGAVAQKVAH